MSKIKVLIAEDHTIVRQGLYTLLKSHGNFEVIAEAKDGIEAIEKTKVFLPDIVVMDITMPGLNGVEATRQIKKTFPWIKIVVLTMHNDNDYIRQVFQAGATCYLNKESADSDLIAALEAAYHNQTFLCPTASKIVVENYINQSEKETVQDSFELLTLREKIILQLIAEGHSNKEMATRLNISINTINNHRSHIMKKLDIHDTATLTKYALKRGLTKI
jgi:DNA-binding NarL/FixJ family response regulator